jgi:hypothetical protein
MLSTGLRTVSASADRFTLTIPSALSPDSVALLQSGTRNRRTEFGHLGTKEVAMDPVLIAVYRDLLTRLSNLRKRSKLQRSRDLPTS